MEEEPVPEGHSPSGSTVSPRSTGDNTGADSQSIRLVPDTLFVLLSAVFFSKHELRSIQGRISECLSASLAGLLRKSGRVRPLQSSGARACFITFLVEISFLLVSINSFVLQEFVLTEWLDRLPSLNRELLPPQHRVQLDGRVRRAGGRPLDWRAEDV